MCLYGSRIAVGEMRDERECCFVELTLAFDVHGANCEGVNEVSREMGMTHFILSYRTMTDDSFLRRLLCRIDCMY